MPRLRFSSFMVGFGAVSVLLAGPAADALAQNFAQNSAALLSPQLDGDPRRPPRFQRGNVPRDVRASATFQLDSAAGATGFDSSGTRKRKGSAKSKSGGKANVGSKVGSKTASASAAMESSPYGSAQPLVSAPAGTQVTRRRTLDSRLRGTERGNDAFASPLRRRPPVPDDAPFDPLGIRLGAFNFKPAIEVTGGYDTNPGRTANRTPSLYAVVSPELIFKSNWSRHEFAGDLRGSYISYGEISSLNRPSADSKLTGRVDVTRDTRVDLDSRLVVGTDNPGSPNIQAGLSKLPIYTTLGGNVGLGQRFNRFDVSLKGGVERTVYQASTFTDGTSASNDDRNFNRYSTLLRGSYELTPAVKPFIEAGADRRVHDLDVDVFGYRRNSDGRSIKAGTSFELTRIITGEVALGWLTRRYQDPALLNLSGLTFDASLTWVASALTTAKLTAVTRADESRVPGVAGVFTREVALQVEHAFRRWLTATGKLLYGNDDYVGSPRDDNRYSASAALTYKLNRELWLKSEYRHDWLRSSVAGANYSADVFLVGLRAQR